MERVYNLKEKSEEEVLNTYKKVALNGELLREIWKKSANYDNALKIYNQYKENKSDANKLGD